MATSPIIPVGAQPMRTLTLSMAVMCYLATLSVGALILVQSAIAQWTSGIEREVTVQVRPIANSNIAAETGKASEILRLTPGVRTVRLLDRSDVEKLLEPWLGDARAVEDLPLPALIAVTIDENRPPDFVALETSLKEKVAGATLDTHRRWQAQLMRTAATLQRLSLAVLALIAISAGGLVVFATRSVLESNREVIEVLHMVGAKDQFIARSVKGRFLRSGFLAGLIGTCGGLLTFAALGLFGAPGSDAISEASARLLLAPPGIAAATYAVFLLVPVVATLLSVVTAHLAVMRQLRTIV